MAFKGLSNLHLTSYDDGLIDDGEFIVYTTRIIRLFEAIYISIRHTAFVFVLKLSNGPGKR